MIPLTKKIAHRNHIIEYFPKEEKLTYLVQDYTSNLFSSDFHDHITNKCT